MNQLSILLLRPRWTVPLALGVAALAITVTFLDVASPIARAATATIVFVDARVAGNGEDSLVDLVSGHSVTIDASGFMTSAPLYLQYPYTLTCPISTLTNNPYVSDPSGTRYLQGGATCVPFIPTGTRVPSAPIGALLARIGTSGAWTVAGAHFQGPAWQSGRLYLMVNDSGWGDNSGIYKVVVTAS